MFLRVAVPVPQLDLLTYRVPPDGQAPPVGSRVVVPLGSRVVTGIVVEVASSLADEPGLSEADVKPILRALDEAAFVPADVVELARWTAEYYAAGAGATVLAVLPPKTRGTRADAHKVQRIVAIARDASAAGAPVKGRAAEAIALLAEAPDGLPVAALAARGIRAPVITKLAREGRVTVREERLSRDPFASAGADDGGDEHDPTAEQLKVLERLMPLAGTGAFQVALLHGVTGSGKTEVYVRLAQAARARGRGVIVLVPEIALTPAVATRFRRAFGDRVAVQHSGLSDGERHDQWHRIRRGEIDVVVGTRSAVFAPIAKPGLVIVDEEHDAAYKQEEAPRYHARDVAIVRGQKAGALVVLGSATPSIESYHHALHGKYIHAVLAKRVLERPLPSVSVVDMREEYAALGPDVVISRPLQEAIEKRLAAGEQALVLLNRRGFATSVFCRQCAGTIDCPNCSVSLVIHGEGKNRRARCHYCNATKPVPATCPKCAAPYLEQSGFGTERVAAEVLRQFPGARVARLDRDAIRKRGALETVLGRFRNGEIDVLVGTQMIAKGHDFPRVTLVGVVSADVGLGMADFRASERTFQLLTQVAGRAGRGDTPGEAIVQTIYPGHYSIELACRQDYPAFYEREVKFRESMRYPPRVALVNIVVRGDSLPGAMKDAGYVADAIGRDATELVVLGPAPAPLTRLRGQYRAQVLVKGVNRRAMRQAIVGAVAANPGVGRRTVVDVDPLSVL